MAEMVRVNTRISAVINEWLDKESEITGVPKSTLIHMALETYMQQKKSVEVMQMTTVSLSEIADRITKIERQLSSGDFSESRA